jgi:hypothetical protein
MTSHFYLPSVNQTKIKNIIFCVMPGAWQTNFAHVNDMSTSTILQLQQFMSQEREFSEQSQNSNGRRTGSHLTPNFHAHSDAQTNYDDRQDDNDDTQDDDDVQNESLGINDVTQDMQDIPAKHTSPLAQPQHINPQCALKIL